jgi:hypothetical protein
MTGISRVSKRRAAASVLLATTFGLVGAVVAPGRASAAPWTVHSLSDGVTAAQLAASLVGPGITVNSASFVGDGRAAGTFDDPAASVGLAGGIVLSSGDVHDVIGPNDASNTTTNLGQPGSTELTTLAGAATHDAAQLDVSFTPTNPQLAINYVFASEEYEEFVGSQFNDVFAFFVNGVNCAVTPGTVNPIAINTVNPGSNALFYVPNEPATFDTQFDGFTVVLTCRAAVNPGVPNTLRVAIADTSDFILDSAVFLQASGVSSNPIGPLKPVTPNRLLDTRFQSPAGLSSNGAGLTPQAIIPAGGSISLKVTGGEVTADALAVALNITAVDAVGSGFLTVFPDGGAQPNASSVNFSPGEASPNAVISRVGTGGRIRIFASAAVNVIVDVFGWFGTGGTDRLFTVVPDRVKDTRFSGGPVGAGQTLDVQVAGTAKVPNGSTAAVLNVTAAGGAGQGYLTVYPSDKPVPNVSSVNFLQGEARPNTVIAPLGPDGKIKIFASEKTDVIVDVMGWFGPAGQTEYVEVSSQRLFDSRQALFGGAKLAAGSVKQLQVVGQFVPPNARAVVLNVTIAEPDASGFATVYPGGAPQPNTSNLNYRAGQAIPNAVIVGLGPTGALNVFTSASTHLLVDVVGYFA